MDTTTDHVIPADVEAALAALPPKRQEPIIRTLRRMVELAGRRSRTRTRQPRQPRQPRAATERPPFWISVR